MKERPILFNAAMTRATLEGRKTQTRRVIKPQPSDHHWKSLPDYHYKFQMVETGGGPRFRSSHTWRDAHSEDSVEWFKCPYGVPGDRLWVRETFRVFDDDYRWVYGKLAGTGPFENVEYDATYDEHAPNRNAWPWRPSIFMPRWASRITLEVTDVRVERVKSISREDAIAEGMNRMDKRSYTDEFHDLWDSINAKRGFGWNANPWVWVVEFEILEVKR